MPNSYVYNARIIVRPSIIEGTLGPEHDSVQWIKIEAEGEEHARRTIMEYAEDNGLQLVKVLNLLFVGDIPQEDQGEISDE